MMTKHLSGQSWARSAWQRCRWRRGIRRRTRSRSAGGTSRHRPPTRTTCGDPRRRRSMRPIRTSDLTIDFRGTELDKQLRVAMLSGSGPDVVYTPGPSYVASHGAGRAVAAARRLRGQARLDRPHPAGVPRTGQI